MADGPVVLLTSLNVPGPALAAGLQREGVALAGIVVQRPDVSPPPRPSLRAAAKHVAKNSIGPRVAVVWGTGILKDVLDVPGQLTVNAHSSILPDYRGTFVEFWQCYNRDLDQAFVTFHVED